MKCFYHSADLDGHCSGEIIRRAHPECEMIGINYGDNFPWDTIEPNEVIYMVDFSLQPWADMVRLSTLADLVWIDHHKSAMDSFDDQPIDCAGKRTVGLGACALVWDWFHGTELPKAVRLLAEYDVWNHHDPDCMPFQYGMRLHEHTPGATIWGAVIGCGDIDSTVRQGRTILTYQSQQYAIEAKSACFEVQLDGLRCIVANRGLANSQLFDSVWDPELYDCMMTFHWRKGCWNISLYSSKPNVDVGTVAKQRGGGGHQGAAGFQCSDLPFPLPLK